MFFFVYFSDVNCWSLLGSLILLFVCYWLSPSIFLCSCSCSQFSDSSPSLSCDQCHDLWILMAQFIVHFTLNGCMNENEHCDTQFLVRGVQQDFNNCRAFLSFYCFDVVGWAAGGASGL